MYHFQKRYFWVLTIYILLQSCADEPQKVFKILSAEETGINFSNQLEYTDSLTVLDFEYMYNGGGVALIDVNNDGLSDVFFTGNMTSSRLYLNKGNLKFQDITEQAGVSTTGWCYGASVVDINQDGFKDIYVCKAGNRKTKPTAMRNLFFINNGNGTFKEASAEMGLDDDGYDIQAAFFDYDKDGDLDMYLLRNAFVDYNRNNVRIKQIKGQSKSTDKLFRNNGDLTFTDVSKQSGITIEGFGLGVAICDVNNDAWPDVFVSNDFLTNDLLWINQHDGTFVNQASTYLRHQTYNSMGNDVADFNNDGLEDIIEVDMLPPDNKRRKLTIVGNRWDEFFNSLDVGYEPQYVRNTLQLNSGKGYFSEIGQLSGVSATEWSWSPLFADFDNDGHKDLFIANGYREDITNLDFMQYGRRALFMGTAEANKKERLNILKSFPGIHVSNYIFQNTGELNFLNVSKSWGIDVPSYSNGAAYGDLDNDGDLDLVINNIDQKAFVYENQTSNSKKPNYWLRIKFEGPKGNWEGLGTKVSLWHGGTQQYQFLSPVRGYLSSVEPYLHFGLKDKQVDSLSVTWPDGKMQGIQKPTTNTTVLVRYADAKKTLSPKDKTTPTLFVQLDSLHSPNYRHQEDAYIDFKAQAILPHLHSRNGPGLAVADINNDGLSDFYVGGAHGQDGAIFIQNKKDGFQKKLIPHGHFADDMGALFFDVDGDHDQDMYVASGGALENKNGSFEYSHRMYLNDGLGNFTLTTGILPDVKVSGSSVIAADYDHDGDLDLFVAGRLSPGDYPITPQSFLLRNDTKNGIAKLVDLSNQLPEGGKIGMISSALWTDFDNDNWVDLILVGEFMPITFLKNTKGSFSSIILPHSTGWWNSVVGADFDKDGDIDYVVGNRGLNNLLKTSTKEPIRLIAKDFDKNGRIDPILCCYIDGEEHVTHSRDDLNSQITPMKARFKDYTSYAEATFEKSFRKDELEGALILTCETLANSIIENKGNGAFEIKALPMEAQFAPLYGMIAEDLDNDGNVDIMAAGNFFSSEVQNGMYDAQGLLVLMGDGKGNFRKDLNQINPRTDNKALVHLQSASHESLIVVSTNNGTLTTYKIISEKRKTIDVKPEETFAIQVDESGHSIRHEFYYGSSYLSQSARNLILPSHTKSLAIYDHQGNSRKIELK